MTGGHVTFARYLDHIANSGLGQVHTILSDDSVRDESNLFLRYERADRRPLPDDVLVLGGTDWELAEALGLLTPDREIINIIQNVRHSYPGSPLYPWLSHNAVRICISREVRDAVLATDRVRGPVYMIANAMENIEHLQVPWAGRRFDVTIAGAKRPQLAEEVASALERHDLGFDLMTKRIPHDEFISRLSQARVAITLPGHAEGAFTVPASCMYLDVAVICGDVPGIRQYCIHDETAIIAGLDAEELSRHAAELSFDHLKSQCIRNQALQHVKKFDVDSERQSFISILNREIHGAREKREN